LRRGGWRGCCKEKIDCVFDSLVNSWVIAVNGIVAAWHLTLAKAEACQDENDLDQFGGHDHVEI
jgi:hypothetical protein